MILFTPDHNTSLEDAFEDAINISKALDNIGMYAYIVMKYHNYTIGINELMDAKYEAEKFIEKINKDYKFQNTTKLTSK